MPIMLNKNSFYGFVALLFVSFIFVYLEVSSGVFRQNLFSKVKVSSTTNFFSLDFLTRSLSYEQKQTPQPTKEHKCYHLNWQQSNLTQEVFSTCGFIAIQQSLGRTGNNMFQVASLFGIAHDLDLIPVIDPNSPLRNQYNLPNVMDIKLENVHYCDEESEPRVYIKCELPNGKKIVNMSMSGYRQSWKYFQKIESVVAEIFRKDFKGNTLSKAKSFVKTVSNATYTVVGIHIRRTDILIYRSNGSNCADVNYFNKAMTFIKLFYHKVRFIIMSDDLIWGKDNLKSSDTFYSPFKNASDDMALMSLCNHMIVTYGTFGWWGAWLANGTTVYLPEKYIEPVKVMSKIDSDYFVPGSI
ncbi:glycosyltransferase 11 [Mactra antiquata]